MAQSRGTYPMSPRDAAVLHDSLAIGTGVNAAGVAGVATPNILTSVLFFRFSGTSEYRKSPTIHGHMDLLKTTHPECTVSHHAFRDEKFINILGRGTVPPHTPY